MTDEQLGYEILSFFKGAKYFIKTIGYGIKEIFTVKENKKGKKSYRNLIGFFIFTLFCIAIYVFAETIVLKLPEPSSSFAITLGRPITFKVLSILLLVMYVKFKGDDKVRFLNSFNEKFEAVGLHSKLTREVSGPDGKKVKVKDYPKLIKIFENKDNSVYVFKCNGIPISEWRRKIPELEAVLGLGILKINNKEGSTNVVTMVTVPYEVKEERKKLDEKFEKIGLYTNNGGYKEYPEFISEEEDGRKVIYVFESEAIPLISWKAKKDKLESVFDCNILSIENKNSKKTIEMTTVPSRFNIKESYKWDNNHIPEKDFEVVLGEGLLEKITLNFNSTPHLLIAGLTGSGKSVLERCITWQILKKGAKGFFVDFKGGLELGAFKDFGEVVYERKRVLHVLDSLVKEHHARIKLFKAIDAKNIVEYNSKVSEENRLIRVFLVVDEIAELLDSTGVSKEEKEVYEAIEARLNTLARLSRATGINMILATQRPDSNVIKGQIKNNLGARISGRMTDKEPSIMVLGSPEATKLPENIKGRFLFSLGAEPVEFQAYYFKDEDIKPGNYEKGTMLVADNKKVEIRENKLKVEASAVEVNDDIKDEVKKDIEFQNEVKKDEVTERRNRRNRVKVSDLDFDYEELEEYSNDYDYEDEKDEEVDIDLSDPDLYGELEDCEDDEYECECEY